MTKLHFCPKNCAKFEFLSIIWTWIKRWIFAIFPIKFLIFGLNIELFHSVLGLLGTYLFVKAISNCSCSWFINDPENFQSGNDSSIFSSLPKKIVKMKWFLKILSNNITFENHWSKRGLSPLLCYNYDPDKLRLSPSFWSIPSKKSPQGRKFYFQPCTPLPIWVFRHRWQPWKSNGVFELWL